MKVSTQRSTGSPTEPRRPLQNRASLANDERTLRSVAMRGSARLLSIPPSRRASAWAPGTASSRLATRGATRASLNVTGNQPIA